MEPTPGEPQLPNLSALNLNHKPRRELTSDAQNGIYCLNREDSIEGCSSQVLLYRNALPIRDGEFEEAAQFMINQVKQEQKMGNRVPRKQCTFGSVKYKQYQLFSDTNSWPSIVKRVREATQAFAAQLGIANPNEYDGVHANFYADEEDSVIPHSDAEKQLVKGEPIFSYTYIINNNDELARGFQIYKMPSAGGDVDGKGKVADIILKSGDLLVMMGDMQELFNHGIDKRKGKKSTTGARLNFTVRKFVQSEKVLKRKAGD